MSRDLKLTLHKAAANPAGYSLVIHAGAGGRVEELTLEAQRDYSAGLRDAYTAGEAVLQAGGAALDAVCAAVSSLEDNPLFNAGRGAALTATGHAELDASVMTGDGHAGAVAASKYAKNPVQLARKVMDNTEHVLLTVPSRAVANSWGLETVEPEYFVTKARQAQLARVRAELEEAARHGTVGAAAVDQQGRYAAATSTGGMVNQHDGRVGDTPIIGAGTFARDGVAAVSCTGEGESFIRGSVAHDVVSRLRYLNADLPAAVEGTMSEELTARNASGGIIAASSRGIVAAFNSPAMFAAYRDGDELVTLT